MYLLGASGHAKVIMDILELNQVDLVALFDKNLQIKELKGYPVRPETEVDEKHPLILAIGHNSIRKELAKRFYSYSYGNAIHPGAVISKSVAVGNGTVIMANAVINTDTKIGDHVIINTSASIDHDCEIDDYVHIAPNTTLAGGVTIGEGTLVGAGSVILPNVTVGKWCTIGAGAVINKDVEDGLTIVGNPGRII